jgi:RimK family alpha-L-glutamate ligase
MDGNASPILAKQLERRAAAGVWVVAGRSSLTNELLVGALHERGVRAELVEPAGLAAGVRERDVVLGRLDVRLTVDGIEDGLRELSRVERRGICVLNPARSLVACHDKLQTALRLGRLGIPQPPTAHVDWDTPLPSFAFPAVVKPRFGSWGRDVVLCESRAELERCLKRLRDRTWFRRQGALVQAFTPTAGLDLRIVVAAGRVVGAIERVAAAGEWRTNVALGGSRRPASPTTRACDLAVEAAAALGGDLVGVDLLPVRADDYLVLEVNGAVDFTPEYSLGRDVFDEVAEVVASHEGASDIPAREFG